MCIRDRERVLLGAHFGHAIVTNGDLGVCVRQRRDAAFFTNYFGKLVKIHKKYFKLVLLETEITS